MALKPGDKVKINDGRGNILPATVKNVPPGKSWVSVKTDDGRTFMRQASEVAAR